MPVSKLDLCGRQFGRWTVLERAPQRGGQKTTWWKCLCDCGKEKVVNGRSLQAGTSKSCGCLSAELVSSRSRKRKGHNGMRALYATYRGKAAERDLPFELTVEQFEMLTSAACAYCGAPPNQVSEPRNENITPTGRAHGRYLYNGVDRVDNDQGYLLDNCVPCCMHCNRAKHTRTRNEFVSWIRTAYNHLKQLRQIA